MTRCLVVNSPDEIEHLRWNSGICRDTMREPAALDFEGQQILRAFAGCVQDETGVEVENDGPHAGREIFLNAMIDLIFDEEKIALIDLYLAILDPVDGGTRLDVEDFAIVVAS